MNSRDSGMKSLEMTQEYTINPINKKSSIFTQSKLAAQDQEISSFYDIFVISPSAGGSLKADRKYSACVGKTGRDQRVDNK